MIFPNPVNEKLARGEVSIGSWLNLASPLAAEVLADAAMNGSPSTPEHTAWDLAEITHAVRAIEARGAVPMAGPGRTTPRASAASSTPA